MHWRQDIGSKLFDGMIAALLLYLLMILAMLLIGPIQARAGRPGLLIYCLTLIALSVYFLEHSLLLRIPDSYRAWYGMLGGLNAWAAVNLSNSLGISSITNVTGVLILIMVSLTVTRLWRHHLPLGAKFYSQTFLTAWIGQLMINGQPLLIAWRPEVEAVYRGVGYLAVIAVLGLLWWLFARSDRRIQRLSAAPLLTFCVVLAAYILI